MKAAAQLAAAEPNISFSTCNGTHRYQVRINRFGIQYSKAFKIRKSARNALRKAKRWRNAALKLLCPAVPPTAGCANYNRSPGGAHIETDCHYQTRYWVAAYRNENGRWCRVMRSIGKYGTKKARQLAIDEAKRRHVPHPDAGLASILAPTLPHPLELDSDLSHLC